MPKPVGWVLQQDLGRLEEWESEWDMSVHSHKCSRLLLTRKTLHGQTLETVSAARYLGVTIQSNLGWDRHINNICAKANKLLGFLRQNLTIGSRKIEERTYKATLRPTLEHASSVWDIPHQQVHLQD